jgi:aromatic-L-amino-acid/L-tryptophan decarboxylase
VTLDWLAQLLGLPPGLHGHLEDGASFGTMAALAAARGAKPGAGVVVCSEHAHSSVAKACRLLGLESRATPVDEAFRLIPDAMDLTDACAVVATIGTTSTSSIDPVGPIAAACEREGIWLHVDAAYAGSAAVCPELRDAFAGWERADSIVVNPHKWLSTTMGCSAFWTRRPEDLRAAFSLVPEFLRVSEDVASLSEYSPALGRQFRALKLWAVLRCYGREGLQQRIREAIALAALFEGWVRDEPGWEVTAPRPFSLVCFRRDGTDAENEALLERVNATGEIFISHTKLNGRYTLRLAVGNARTTEADVRRAWDVLRACSEAKP